MKPSFVRVSVAVLGFLLAAGPTTAAFAQKKKAAPAAAKKKPAEEKKAAAPGAKKPEERKGPAQFVSKKGAAFDPAKAKVADKKRDEAIEQLKKIIPKIEDGSPQKADLLYQLAELYWEKQKYLLTKANDDFSKAIEEFEKAKDRGEKLAEPKLDDRMAELYRSETMRLYETILRDYPTYVRKDEVLFNLGYNLYETNKKPQAVKRYEELAKNYPDSRLLADTYIQLANHYFEGNDLTRARVNYEKALKTQNKEIYSYALYKLAWCDYNAAAFEEGLKKFQSVVDFADKNKQSDLKSEALKDMVLTWVQLNRPDDAVAYYERKAPKKRQARLISSLAFNLAEAGNHESAIKVFRGLIDKEPTRVEAPGFQQEIIRSYDKLRLRDQVKIEVRRLAELYSPGATWWKANEQKPAVLKDAFAIAEEAMRGVVTDYHTEAQKTKQVETYRLARDIYKQYVESFATSENPDFVSDFAFNMKYYYADILWALEEWENAAKQYEGVVSFKIPNRDTAKEVAREEYRKQASYNTILAYARLVKIERGELVKTELQDGKKIDEKAKKGGVEKAKKVVKRSAKELEEKALTGYEKSLVAACDTYNDLYKSNSDEIEVAYQAAVIFYDRNHFLEAGRRFTTIIDKFPSDRRSQEAADLTMGVLEEKEEWLQLNKSARTFLANKKLIKPGTEFARRVTTVVEGSQYKYVDEVVYKKEKNYDKAANLFVDFVKEFPNSQNADRALTYSMFIFRDAKQIDRALEMGERVLKEYASTPLELKVRYTLADFYGQTAQFRKSAEMYEAFIASTDLATGEKKPDPKAKKGKKPAKGEWKSAINDEEKKALVAEAKAWLEDAHFNTALWWEGLGETDKAIAGWNTFMTRYKATKDVPSIAFNIGRMLERQKKWPEAIKQFEKFNADFAKDKRATALLHYQSRVHQWRGHTELKNQKELDRLKVELLKGYPGLSAEEKKDFTALNAYAHMKFLELEPMWKDYQDIKFTKVSTLKKDFARKQKKIEEVQRAYTQVIALGDGEFGIASLTRIGLAFGDFAVNITDSPDPKGLDEEQADMYRSELENMAFPLEEKAIEALEKATAKAYELNIYNAWTLMAQDRINKYRPGYYAKPVQNVAYQGSEFFLTAPVEKVLVLAPKSPTPAQPDTAPTATDGKPSTTPATPATGSPTAAAGQP